MLAGYQEGIKPVKNTSQANTSSRLHDIHLRQKMTVKEALTRRRSGARACTTSSSEQTDQ